MSYVFRADPAYQVWIVRYADWTPGAWNEVPPQATVLEPASGHELLSRAAAANYVRAFNVARPNVRQGVWAVAVRVRVRIESPLAWQEPVPLDDVIRFEKHEAPADCEPGLIVCCAQAATLGNEFQGDSTMIEDATLFPIHTWHVVISGFLQNEGRPVGMVRLWRLLDAEHAAPGVRVELRNWNENWRQFAELIWRVQPPDGSVRVLVYAYSWGAGWGAMELARKLSVRGVPVRSMILSDPVYRSPRLLFRWRSLFPRPQIIVPRNVQDVFWFRQQRSRPAGHMLVAEDPKRTAINPPQGRIADVGHAYMDDLLAFHEACRQQASRLRRPSPHINGAHARSA